MAGLVIYGMGGIGKSTLAAQIASRLSRLAPERQVITLSGELSAPSLATVPAATSLLVLDDFDDNLCGPPGQRTVADPALAALLAAWTGKLLITCTEQPQAPPGPGDRFVLRHLGPLTRSGAAELALSLPALRLAGEARRELAWRLTAGHPRAMEYLDALLAAGARLDDLAERVAAAVQASTGLLPAATEPTELPAAAAEAIAQTAGQQLLGELFDRLSPGAQDLLVRASVFRTPVAPGVLAASPAHLAECETAGLLTSHRGRELAVHRWTAAELHRRLAEAGQTARLAAAHRSAQAPPEPREAAAPRSGLDRSRLRRLALASVAAVTAALVALEATNSLSASHLASAERPDHRAVPVPLAQADAARDQAAAWAVSQLGQGAIVACDQVMCAALVRHGFPAANLLVLGPGAADPLGSAIVLATAAIRAMFGSRLVTVYAPQAVASFGSGPARVDVRAVAPDGAAAYRTALAADVRARQVAGRQLLAHPRVSVPAPARAELAAGRVDARLLISLAAMAATEPVRILAFGGLDPGASPGTALRTVEILAPAATARAMLAFVRAQRPPYLATRSELSAAPHGQTLLTIEFAAPTPLGLLPPAP